MRDHFDDKPTHSLSVLRIALGVFTNTAAAAVAAAAAVLYYASDDIQSQKQASQLGTTSPSLGAPISNQQQAANKVDTINMGDLTITCRYDTELSPTGWVYVHRIIQSMLLPNVSSMMMTMMAVMMVMVMQQQNMQPNVSNASLLRIALQWTPTTNNDNSIK
jgi:hypothetical protein